MVRTRSGTDTQSTQGHGDTINTGAQGSCSTALSSMLCVAGSILNWAGAELGQAIKVPNYVGKRDPVDYYILGMGGIGTGAALHQHGSCPCLCPY